MLCLRRLLSFLHRAPHACRILSRVQHGKAGWSRQRTRLGGSLVLPEQWPGSTRPSRRAGRDVGQSYANGAATISNSEWRCPFKMRRRAGQTRKARARKRRSRTPRRSHVRRLARPGARLPRPIATRGADHGFAESGRRGKAVRAAPQSPSSRGDGPKESGAKTTKAVPSSSLRSELVVSATPRGEFLPSGAISEYPFDRGAVA